MVFLFGAFVIVVSGAVGPLKLPETTVSPERASGQALPEQPPEKPVKPAPVAGVAVSEIGSPGA